MKIVIDLQGAQSESRFRGIGRYSMSIAQALVRNRGDHEIVIALSGLFPETIEPIREIFSAFLPQENIRIWYASGPVCVHECGNEWRREVAELTRESFLAGLDPDFVFITSLFEGYFDNAVTSVGRLSVSYKVATILYDLIPYSSPEAYLPSQVQKDDYYQKIEFLRKSNVLLGISNSSSLDIIDKLKISPSRVVTISSAIEDKFRQICMSDLQEKDLLNRYRIFSKFIMYVPGGFDPRKNFENLINAYAKLPQSLKKHHKLVIVGKASDATQSHLKSLASRAGLKGGDLVLTGYVSDNELIGLYNIATLFVFPSKFEGFGLPVLEAMSCGAPVVCANNSSLSEVIDRKDALFDPYSVEDITTKIEEALSNDVFRDELRCHGLKRSKLFSWDKTARRALTALEDVHQQRESKPLSLSSLGKRKLAYVSPLPPERSGISWYSAELIPALSQYYDVDIIISQNIVEDLWIAENCQIKTVEWFLDNSDIYDRVLYHFGNSPFHQHMFDMSEKIPGVVVLHDFFLSAVIEFMERHGAIKDFWSKELYKAHGYRAIIERFGATNIADIIYKYPCNSGVLSKARGVIVHSESSRRLASHWYGQNNLSDWTIVPLLKNPAGKYNRAKARNTLNIDNNDFIVCSFGALDSTKLNHRLMEAWFASSLGRNENCKLVFVGENHHDGYGRELLHIVHCNHFTKKISITGWVDEKTYRNYLMAADMGVQLRTNSRGETSAAVLDCMNYGLPTIVNANGSLSDLPDSSVRKLPDDFDNDQLVEALELFWRDSRYRKRMGMKASEYIHTYHAPPTCAEQYFAAIEKYYRSSAGNISFLLGEIANIRNPPEDINSSLVNVADSIARSMPEKNKSRQLLIDVSVVCRDDFKTGIQRVVRALMLELLKNPPEGYFVEPVYLSNEEDCWLYRYARNYTMRVTGCPEDILYDEVVTPQNGDWLLGLDFSGAMVVEAGNAGLYDDYRQQGISVYFVVYDLLPILSPQFFPPRVDNDHLQWIKIVAQNNGAICISETVSAELDSWLKKNAPETLGRFKNAYFHLGADIDSSSPTLGLPADADIFLDQLESSHCFLMVGTVEPRKGYLQALEAFTELWKQGVEVCLVIVGHEGWKHLPNNLRRTIPEIVERLRCHPELGKHLFWLEGITDEYLEKIYAVSICLLAASEGEGFGLPLIEAAQHKLPIIVRDLPVFREVAGDHALYFSGLEPKALADAIVQWLSLYEAGIHPTPDNMPWLAWEESVKQLVDQLHVDSVPFCVSKS